jgi:hypothetical protein
MIEHREFRFHLIMKYCILLFSFSRLINKQDNHNPPVISNFPNTQGNGELLSPITQLPPPPVVLLEEDKEPRKSKTKIIEYIFKVFLFYLLSFIK